MGLWLKEMVVREFRNRWSVSIAEVRKLSETR